MGTYLIYSILHSYLYSHDYHSPSYQWLDVFVNKYLSGQLFTAYNKISTECHLTLVLIVGSALGKRNQNKQFKTKLISQRVSVRQVQNSNLLGTNRNSNDHYNKL